MVYVSSQSSVPKHVIAITFSLMLRWEFLCWRRLHPRCSWRCQIPQIVWQKGTQRRPSDHPRSSNSDAPGGFFGDISCMSRYFTNDVYNWNWIFFQDLAPTKIIEVGLKLVKYRISPLPTLVKIHYPSNFQASGSCNALSATVNSPENIRFRRGLKPWKRSLGL